MSRNKRAGRRGNVEPASARNKSEQPESSARRNLPTSPPVRLTTHDLAARWRTTPGRIRRLRVAGVGPRFLKVGPGPLARCLYELADVEAHETAHTFENTLASASAQAEIDCVHECPSRIAGRKQRALARERSKAKPAGPGATSKTVQR